MTLDEAIKNWQRQAELDDNCADKCVAAYGEDNDIVKSWRECAAYHRQLAEWLGELKELRSIVDACNILALDAFAVENLCKELKEAKRLLKAAVEDFAKLDRENTKNKNCMMSEMDCADCPLSWDSVDDRVEPCHSWRYTNEALKLIGGEPNGI